MRFIAKILDFIIFAVGSVAISVFGGLLFDASLRSVPVSPQNPATVMDAAFVLIMAFWVFVLCLMARIYRN